MTNILLKYLAERHKSEIENNEELIKRAPVITISREFGCPANLCASELAELLSQIEGSDSEPWKIISKEILEQAAKELGLTPDKIEFIFKFEKRSAVDEIMEALSSKYYKSERKIRNTIKNVIKDIGEQGRAIIVGRAGSSILKDMPNSLHIRLIAPINYRIKEISRKHKISIIEARKLTLDMDKKRAQLRKEFAGRSISDVDYDLIFNTMNFKPIEMAEIIMKAIHLKGIIH
ncbi:MAG: cytidylate kinase-like family protein [Bacteroidales bacterium]|nr:cytidylate kinase-like family protein [Bacteroidales bacterium]